MGIYKMASEVAATLGKRYDGPIAKRQGAGGKDFSYVPWTTTLRLLNEVFGIFGWSTSAPRSYFANGTFNVEFGLSATVIDDETGQVVTKTVPAQGQATARTEGDDNALKSAQSDALSRGAKLLGDAFGFYLYEEKGTSTPAPRSTTGTYTAQTGNGNLGPRPSDKQMGVLRKAGYPDAQINGLQFTDWKAIIDAIFAKQTPAIAPAPEAELAGLPY